MNFKFGNLTLICFSLLFIFSSGALPLFEGNHSHLLRSIAYFEGSKLSNDWLANQTDPIPVFTFINSFLIKTFSPKITYLFHAILGLILINSCFFICKNFLNKKNSITILAIWFFIFFIIFHEKTFFSGVAGQSVYNKTYQPSTFGVLLILSLCLFIYDKIIISIIIASLSAIIHPTYLIQSIFLISGYCIYLLYIKNYKNLLIAILVALILLTPLLLYLILNFISLDPNISKLGQDIMAEQRIPHHAKITYWFSYKDIQSLIIIILALFLIHKEKNIFIPLTVVCALSLIFTLIHYLTDSNFFGLLFPWRSSVYLNPISILIILSIILNKLVQKYSIIIENYSKVVFSICSLLILALTIPGVKEIYSLNELKNKKFSLALMLSKEKYIHRLLIPINQNHMRMNSGIPIFVDWKSTPYKNEEIINWYERIRLANNFYLSSTFKERYDIFNQITKLENISHFVVKKQNQNLFINCKKILEHKDLILYSSDPCMIN